MTIKLNEENGGKLVALVASGKLTKADYDYCIPEFERLIKQHGKLRVMLDISDFHGWIEGSALWEEMKFDFKHYNDFERIAVVGDKKWHQKIATFSKPFTKAAIQYFNHAESAEAMKWLREV